MYEALGNLSLDLLRAFEAAARHRSFTAAAMELGTTQPAVSQQIKRLEEQLAVRLFDRIYRGIELTDAGVLLFEHVQAGLQSINTGLSTITQQDQHEVLQVADDRVKIDYPGGAESLNAAVSGALLLFEALRQRAKN